MTRDESDKIADHGFELIREAALNIRRSQGLPDRRKKHSWEEGMSWEEIDAQNRQRMRDNLWLTFEHISLDRNLESD